VSVLWLSLVVACVPISRGERVSLPSDRLPVQRGLVADEALADAVDQAVLAYLDGAHMPGLAVAVYAPGEPLYTAGYGWADLQTERRLRADTPVLLSSVSKTFIGVTALQGVEAGRLGLDQPIREVGDFGVYNPRLDDAPEPRLRHLLTHTSGLHDSYVYGSNYGDGDPVIPLDDFVLGYIYEYGRHHVRSNWSKRRPGEAYEYSNVGAATAALAIGNAARLTFRDLVRRDVLEPVGMIDSFYLLADQTQPPAYGYDRAGDDFRAWAHYGYPTYPDGLMRSSADDMARYAAMVLGDGALDGVEVLPAARVDEMLTVDRSIDAGSESQAVVWVSQRLNGHTVFGHNGGDYGSFTELWMDRDRGAGALLLFTALPEDGDDYERIRRLETALMDAVVDR